MVLPLAAAVLGLIASLLFSFLPFAFTLGHDRPLPPRPATKRPGSVALRGAGHVGEVRLFSALLELAETMILTMAAPLTQGPFVILVEAMFQTMPPSESWRRRSSAAGPFACRPWWSCRGARRYGCGSSPRASDEPPPCRSELFLAG